MKQGKVIPLWGDYSGGITRTGSISLDSSICRRFEDERHLLFQAVFPTKEKGVLLMTVVQSVKIVITKETVLMIGYINAQTKDTRAHTPIKIWFKKKNPEKPRYELI
jgi:hypothetical protein